MKQPSTAGLRWPREGDAERVLVTILPGDAALVARLKEALWAAYSAGFEDGVED